MQRETSLHDAAHWLLHSGIQSDTGAVARHYRTDLKRNSPISNEITGYALSALAYVAEVTGEAVYRERLELTANYLVEHCWNPQLKVFPFEAEDGNATLAYFFDTGIIIRGLLAAERITPHPRWLDVAVRAAHAMAVHFNSGTRAIPVIQIPSLTALAPEPRWSRLSGCYQLKSALAWRDVARRLDDSALESHWFRALSAAFENAPTFLPGDGDPAHLMDRLHAYCYYLEALVCAGGYEAELTQGIEDVARYLSAAENGFVRSDVYAQLLRLRLFAAPQIPLNARDAGQEAQQLASFQCQDADPRLTGGFWFGRDGSTPLPFVNPVSTIFAAQALQMWAEWGEGRREWPPFQLI